MRFVSPLVPVVLALLSGCSGAEPSPEPSPDSDPPQVTLTSPGPGVFERGPVPLAAEADDNVGIATVRFLVDGAPIGAPITSPPFEATWDVPDAVADGDYTLTAAATDAAGNQAVSPGVLVTLFSISSLRVTTASAGLDVDPDGYRIILDGAEAATVAPSGSTLLPGLRAGPHSIGLAGIAGNCALGLPRVHEVNVAFGVEAAADFSVRCGLVSGPTAERILFSRPNGQGEQVHAVNADGTGHVQLTDDQYNYVYMAWSPDRTTVLFRSDRPGASTYANYLMDADGTNIRPVDEAITSTATWSPDGIQLAYVNAGIWISNLDGTGKVQLTTDPTDREPAWSPDGGRIAFVRNPRPQLHVMNVDGSDVHPISDGYGDESGPKWSPDGTRILYTGNRKVGLEIYVIQDDGTGRRNVTDNVLNDTHPAWSPSGDQIIYTTTTYPEDVLYRVPADGSGVPVPILTGSARFNAWR
jgi:TolB protein